MNIQVSVVIPVYNEEEILEEALLELLGNLRAHLDSFEIIISANGCVDQTEAIAERLVLEHPELLLHRCPQPDYGEALKQGIELARGEFVLCEEIDLCDDRFHRTALAMLGADEELAMVVGSKTLPGARDRRPYMRRLATRVLNRMLRTATGWRGTDTHGLKALRRELMLGVVSRCELRRDLFASEMVIRAFHMSRRVVEYPIELSEKRPPSIGLARRVPKVLVDMGRLAVTVRRNNEE
ncbi:MAG: glycosyltransferase family 2 protein [Myxococcota bacterium]|nr:glycosyltransferase family 2 protein [Myxococcota bacterium]